MDANIDVSIELKFKHNEKNGEALKIIVIIVIIRRYCFH